MYKDIKSILVGNEKLLYEARMHWIVFLFPSIVVSIGLAAGIFFSWIMGALILFMSTYPVINSIIMFLTMRLVLTSKRVIARYGFFSKDMIQIALPKIESAHVEETILGGWLGYVTVVIRGTGTGTIPIALVKKGDRFHKRLENLILKDEDDALANEPPERPTKQSKKANVIPEDAPEDDVVVSRSGKKK